MRKILGPAQGMGAPITKSEANQYLFASDFSPVLPSPEPLKGSPNRF